MRVLLRADASPVQGTGHVMRCLTLAEELLSRGHKVILLTNTSDVDWLEAVKSRSAVQVETSQQHHLDIEQCLSFEPDWVVVDSYEISAQKISELAKQVSVLAIIDGSARGIESQLYLDHNLGAEKINWPVEITSRLLAGSKFALIRDAVLEQRRSQPWIFQNKIPHIVAVMGGSDPTGAIVEASQAIASLKGLCAASIVVNEQWWDAVQTSVGDVDGFEVVRPTTELATLLGSADIAVSASGTSAWELCTLGIPSVLIAVVENQTESLESMIRNELVYGVDVARGSGINLATHIQNFVRKLITESETRSKLSQNSLAMFDGMGKQRVVDVMEATKTL